MKSLHFVGIGGIGMSGLASWCRALGYKVTGSDRDAGKSENAHILSPLRNSGVTIFPQDGSFMHQGAPEALVFSSAIEPDNPDFTAGGDIPHLHRSQLLDLLLKEFDSRCTIAVAGSCGKSTVTAFLSEAIANCGSDAGFLNGAISKRYVSGSSIGNFHAGTGKHFVFEADESDKSLLNYTPDYAIILNMGTDHYSKEELAEVFGKFLNRVKKGAVVEKEVYAAVKPYLNNPDLQLEVFGNAPANECSYQLENYTISRQNSALLPVAEFKGCRKVTLPAPGIHTAANALAVFAMLQMLGFSQETALKAIERFDGIRRRNDCVGVTEKEIPVYDDYAHNPEKIASCIRMLAEITPGRIFTLFQPHGFGPLGFFRDELLETLEKTLRPGDEFFMLPPFYAGGTSSFKPTSEEVISQWKTSASAPERYHFAAERDTLRSQLLSQAQQGDLIVIMGARDNSLSLYARSFCKASQA
ncbi:MAG: hypothetical protein E7048_01130 [Lentisphaerae bacterium]|nr:hypothetical protein [Lentisphaerota bacterium]